MILASDFFQMQILWENPDCCALFSDESATHLHALCYEDKWTHFGIARRKGEVRVKENHRDLKKKS